VARILTRLADDLERHAKERQLEKH
jgi:hypothetical protein